MILSNFDHALNQKLNKIKIEELYQYSDERYAKRLENTKFVEKASKEIGQLKNDSKRLENVLNILVDSLEIKIRRTVQAATLGLKQSSDFNLDDNRGFPLNIDHTKYIQKDDVT